MSSISTSHNWRSGIIVEKTPLLQRFLQAWARRWRDASRSATIHDRDLSEGDLILGTIEVVRHRRGR